MLKAPLHIAHPKRPSLFLPRTIRPRDLDQTIVVPTCWRLTRFFGRHKEILGYGESLLDFKRGNVEWYDYRKNGITARSREARLLDGIPMTPTALDPQDLDAFARATREAMAWLAVSIDQDTAEVLCSPQGLREAWPDPDTLVAYEYYLVEELSTLSTTEILRRLKSSLDTQEINDILEIIRCETNKIDIGDVESNRTRVYLQLEDARTRAIEQGNMNAEIKTLAIQSTILGLTSHAPHDENTQITNIIEAYTPPALSPPRPEEDTQHEED
jgi:hypothetical protein